MLSFAPFGALSPRLRRARPSAACALVAIFLLTASGAPAVAPAATQASHGGPAGRLVNDMCPVMPDEFASPHHEVTVRGVTVRLCCRTCREKFTAEPEKYLHRLGHVPPVPAAAPARRGGAEDPPLSERLLGSWWGPVNRAWRDYEPAYFRWRPLLGAALAVLVVHLAAVRAQRRSLAPRGRDGAAAHVPAPGAGKSPGTGGGRVVGALARPVVMLVALQTLVIVGVALEAARSHAAARAERAARESHDALAGRAWQFAAELARQAIIQGEPRVRQLHGTYFRGNDETGPKLFNGGVYETCRFETSLRDAEGKQVLPGEPVAGKELSVRVEVVRGPHAKGALMNDELMTGVFLAGRTVDPWLGVPRDLPPPALFGVLEPNRRWVAEHPIGEVATGGVQKLKGVILLCRGDPSREQGVPTSAHYALQYHLHVKDGRIVPEASRFWMAALYFTSVLADDQLWKWFSPTPLPTIPADFKLDASLERDDKPAGEPAGDPPSPADPGPSAAGS